MSEPRLSSKPGCLLFEFKTLLLESWYLYRWWNVKVKTASLWSKSLWLRAPSTSEILFVEGRTWRGHHRSWILSCLSVCPLAVVTHHSLIHICTSHSWKSDGVPDFVHLLPMVLNSLKMGIVYAHRFLWGQRLYLVDWLFNFNYQALVVPWNGVKSVPCWPYLGRDWLVHVRALLSGHEPLGVSSFFVNSLFETFVVHVNIQY